MREMLDTIELLFSIVLIRSSSALEVFVPVSFGVGRFDFSLINLISRSAKGPGCSSGIQCPEEGIMISDTLFASRLADWRL